MLAARITVIRPRPRIHSLVIYTEVSLLLNVGLFVDSFIFVVALVQCKNHCVDFNKEDISPVILKSFLC